MRPCCPGGCTVVTAAAACDTVALSPRRAVALNAAVNECPMFGNLPRLNRSALTVRTHHEEHEALLRELPDLILAHGEDPCVQALRCRRAEKGLRHAFSVSRLGTIEVRRRKICS